MRVLHLATTDGGGAGRAAVRLHLALRTSGVDSRMLVSRGSENAESVPALTVLGQKRTHRWRRGIQRRIDTVPLHLFGKAQTAGWAAAWCPGGILPEIRRFAPDVIHLHWITGFLGIGELARLRSWPVVWSLHDLWPLSEGYHYLGGLPGVDITQAGDLSRLSKSRLGGWIWKRKAKALAGLDLRSIGPSRWIFEAARKSALLSGKPSHHIPYCLPLDVFQPVDRTAARRELGLPIDSRLILFGAANSEADTRKGFDLLLDALAVLATKTSPASRPELVVFGSDRSTPIETLHGFRIHRIGKVSDDQQLSGLYSAADVFVAPSREDNLPNTVLESLACGTPCAAFDIGGMGDMIETGVTGVLAPPFDPKMLALRILDLLERSPDLREPCREFALDRYSPESVAAKTTAVYLEALGKEPAAPPRPNRPKTPSVAIAN